MLEPGKGAVLCEEKIASLVWKLHVRVRGRLKVPGNTGGLIEPWTF